MTVYVDDMRIPYRGMLMCHMIGTDLGELHEMAAQIGIRRRHYQSDHYDACQTARTEAIRRGAIPITRQQLAAMRAQAGRTGEMGTPEQAEAWLRAYQRRGIDREAALHG